MFEFVDEIIKTVIQLKAIEKCFAVVALIIFVRRGIF